MLGFVSAFLWPHPIPTVSLHGAQTLSVMGPYSPSSCAPCWDGLLVSQLFSAFLPQIAHTIEEKLSWGSPAGWVYLLDDSEASQVKAEAGELSPGLWGKPCLSQALGTTTLLQQGAPGSSPVWRLKYQDEGCRLACLYSHFRIILVTAWKDFPGWSVHSWENSCGFEDIFPGTERASPAVQSTD